MWKLIDQNFQYHAAKIASQTIGMKIIETESSLLVDSGLSCDTFNIFHIANGSTLSKMELEESIQYYKDRNLEFCIWVNSENLTKDVERGLKELSLSVQNEEIGMTLDLNKYHPIKSDKHHNIKLVNDSARLSDYAHVIASNWSPPDENVINYYETTSIQYLESPEGILLFVYYDGRNAVATVELFPTDKDTVGIYGLATLEDARGQGIGSSLMTYTLNKAKELGYATVVLQASQDGIGIYKKLGFESHTTYYEFG